MGRDLGPNPNTDLTPQFPYRCKIGHLYERDQNRRVNYQLIQKQKTKKNC